MTSTFKRGAGRLVRQARVRAPATGQARDRKPRVSVIIPSYNYARFLTDAVKSALAQEGVEPEIIVVDDASTDDSAAIAERIARVDPRVRVIRNRQNMGHDKTFNIGYAMASGEYIVRLDSDDLLTPGSLSRSVALFEKFPRVGLVYGHPRHFTAGVPDEARTAVRCWSIWSGEDWVAERCRTGANCITTPEVMIRASVMQFAGPLSTTLRYAQDMEMWLRIASVSDVGRVDGPDQAFHRDHPASMTGKSGMYGKYGILFDAAERRAVFETFFSGIGGRLPKAAELHPMARAALADEVLGEACRAYERGRTGSIDVQEYIDFASSTYPQVPDLPNWRALQRRRRVGARIAAVPPLFTGSVVRRRLRWEISYRRWQRTGQW